MPLLAEANYSGAYEDGTRIGGWGTVGMLSDLTEKWKLLGSGTYIRYPLGEQERRLPLDARPAVTLLTKSCAPVRLHHRDHDNDVIFSVQAYF